MAVVGIIHYESLTQGAIEGTCAVGVFGERTLSYIKGVEEPIEQLHVSFISAADDIDRQIGRVGAECRTGNQVGTNPPIQCDPATLQALLDSIGTQTQELICPRNTECDSSNQCTSTPKFDSSRCTPGQGDLAEVYKCPFVSDQGYKSACPLTYVNNAARKSACCLQVEGDARDDAMIALGGDAANDIIVPKIAVDANDASTELGKIPDQSKSAIVEAQQTLLTFSSDGTKNVNQARNDIDNTINAANDVFSEFKYQLGNYSINVRQHAEDIHWGTCSPRLQC